MATTKSTKRTATATTTAVAQDTETENKPVTVKDVDMHQYITVRNGFQGKLVYTSQKTGETFVWDEFGSEQEIELMELKSAKNSAKKFFINNWFMFGEEWVIDYLGLRQYYKHAVKIEDFDKIFEQTPAAIRKTLSELSEGQKKSVAYRARVLISEGVIDSNKAITAIEESLGIELVER